MRKPSFEEMVYVGIFISVIIAVIVFISVYSGQDNYAPNTDKIIDKIVYFEDTRTGLYFAAINSYTYQGHRVTSITQVTPNDKVKELIEETNRQERKSK
jgi:hypothetical protein